MEITARLQFIRRLAGLAVLGTLAPCSLGDGGGPFGGANAALAESVTFHTTTAAISTGLPSASLTFRWFVSKFRTRTLTRRRTVSGSTHQNPGRRTVPM